MSEIEPSFSRQNPETSASRSPLKLLIPLYPDPSGTVPTETYWSEVAAAATKVDITVVVNPDNGPNLKKEQDYEGYRQGLKILRDAGVQILGYVFTGRGLCFPVPPHGKVCKKEIKFGEPGNEIYIPAPPLSKIQKEVDTYYEKFEDLIDGIFFDEFANPIKDKDQLAAYIGLCDYVKQKENQIVVVNPGTKVELNPNPAGLDFADLFGNAADVFVVYENKPENPTSSETDEPEKQWVKKDYSDEREYTSQFACLLYSAPVNRLEAYIDHAIEQGFGFIYITSNTDTLNPWSNLPEKSYWDQEVSYIACVEAQAEESEV